MEFEVLKTTIAIALFFGLIAITYIFIKYRGDEMDIRDKIIERQPEESNWQWKYAVKPDYSYFKIGGEGEALRGDAEAKESLSAEPNMVEHPPHYNSGKFETIDVIEDIVKGYKSSFVGYCVSNSIKYISRAPFKGSFLQDLKKAVYYLNKAISYVEENPDVEM